MMTTYFAVGRFAPARDRQILRAWVKRKLRSVRGDVHEWDEPARTFTRIILIDPAVYDRQRPGEAPRA